MSDGKISFFTSHEVECPACGLKFKQEVMKTGRGRLIAEHLDVDLRRNYKITDKYGKVNPLLYSVTVCPDCYFAAFSEDFIDRGIDKGGVNAARDKRKSYIEKIFDKIPDYNTYRDTLAGAVSYFLAISSYNYYSKEYAPSTKKAICAMRCSWLVKDLTIDYPNGNFFKIYFCFRYLAWSLYEKAIKTAETGEETFDNAKKLGPDVDIDFGYMGLLYILSLLGYELKDFIDEELLYDRFKYYRASLAKVFGFGKSSKEKPSVILDMAKDLHGNISEMLKKLEAKYEDDGYNEDDNDLDNDLEEDSP